MSNKIIAEYPNIIPSIKDIPYSDEVDNYVTDESSIFTGHAEKVFFPRNENEIIGILCEATKKKVNVTISGGGTGLTGGRVPYGGFIISTEHLRLPNQYNTRGLEKISYYGRGMKKHVFFLDYNSKTNEVFSIISPSITLKTFQDTIKDWGLFFPVDPTEDTATFGGMVSTNASGSRSFRYGSIREWITRLRVVLADGGILNIERGQTRAIARRIQITLKDKKKKIIEIPVSSLPLVKKNSTGYYLRENVDLIDLFIGSEGTLGIISEVEVRLLKKTKINLECIVFFPSFNEAIKFVKTIKTTKTIGLSEVVSLEFYDFYSLKFLKDKAQISLKIPEQSHSGVSFEYIIDENLIDSSLKRWDKLLDNYDHLGTYIAMRDEEKKRLKEFRHSLPESINRYVREKGKMKIATDIAVSDETLTTMLDFYNEICLTAHLNRISERLNLKHNAKWEHLSIPEKIKVTQEKSNEQIPDYFKSLRPYAQVEYLRRVFNVEIACLYFGHIGDNHIHFNFLPLNEEEKGTFKRFSLELLRKGLELGGSISAEHGVGKKTYPKDGSEKPLIELVYTLREIKSLAQMKKIFDPYQILNIGNIIPEKYLKTKI